MSLGAPHDRESWLAFGDVLLKGALPFFSADRAFIAGPGEPSRHGVAADGIEGFSRVLLLHALLATARGYAVDEGDRAFIDGITSGVSVASPAWPTVTDTRHVIVDSASIATALWVGDCRLWKALDAGTQHRLAVWLSDCAVSSVRSPNNWKLFGAIVSAFLEAVGRPVASGGILAQSLAGIERLYRGGGWYSDGPGTTFDYYNSFGFHYYLPLLAWLTQDAELLGTSRERLEMFVYDCEDFFARDGAPVHFGRSLTYRFASSAALSTAALIGVVPERSALYRAQTERTVGYFLDHGAVGADGILHRGWFGAERRGVQQYSGPLASYWVSKVFVATLLPSTHPYWAGHVDAVPEPVRRTIPTTGFLLASDDDRAIVRLANHGSFDPVTTDVALAPDDPHYSRLSYSSATAPVSTPWALDAAFTVHGRRNAWTRSRISTTGSGEGWAASESLMRSRSRNRLVLRIRQRLLRSRWGALVASGDRHTAQHVTLSRGAWDVHAAYLSPPLLRRAREVTFGGWPLPGAVVRGLRGLAEISEVQTGGGTLVGPTMLVLSGSAPSDGPIVVASSPDPRGELAPELHEGVGSLVIAWADGSRQTIVHEAAGFRVHS